MKLADILGQERVVDALRRSIAANRVAHAYLFEGPNGCGRRTTALALVQTLFCAVPVAGDACGACPSCRKLAAGHHPDLHLLKPLPDKRDIVIDQVRELQQLLSLRPYEASRKACLIHPAERMTVGAANSLLKTLEEPPAHAVFILATTEPHRIPATILSRCQRYDFAASQSRASLPGCARLPQLTGSPLMPAVWEPSPLLLTERCAMRSAF